MVKISRWDPFEEIKKFLAETEDFLPTFSLLPTTKVYKFPVDMYEKNKNLYVEVGIPGFSKENIRVTFEDNNLIIEGKEEKEEETKDKNYFKKEIIRGEFKRVVPLPCEVDVDKAEATFESGILTIVLPKIKEEKKDKEISIK